MAKTYKNLWAGIISFENLLLAARKAQKGKRFKENVSAFNLNLEKELFRLQRELITKTYSPGRYKEFIVFEPVKRLISAAPYRDRVVHHALCNVVEPLFDKAFIYDTYANRKGKGTHKAIDRFQLQLQKYRYVLKCDIKKYFPSVDHEILFDLLKRKIADADTLWLIKVIIDNSNTQEPVFDHFPGDDLFSPLERRRGLPIGNLTSQFFANVYMNGFDHYVEEILRCKAYARYVDDFAVFGNDKRELWDIRNKMAEYLATLRLKLHPKKTRIFQAKDGCEFLGFHVYPHLRKVKKASIRFFETRLDTLQVAYQSGDVKPARITRAIQGWLAHARHANSRRLVEQVLARHMFSHA